MYYQQYQYKYKDGEFHQFSTQQHNLFLHNKFTPLHSLPMLIFKGPPSKVLDVLSQR